MRILFSFHFSALFLGLPFLLANFVALFGTGSLLKYLVFTDEPKKVNYALFYSWQLLSFGVGNVSFVLLYALTENSFLSSVIAPLVLFPIRHLVARTFLHLLLKLIDPIFRKLGTSFEGKNVHPSIEAL